MCTLRLLARDNKRDILRCVVGGRFALSLNWARSPNFSTVGSKQWRLLGKGPSQLILVAKLEKALKEDQMDEAWETYKDFKHHYGFPNQLLTANLVNKLSYSGDSKYMLRAYNLVLSISNAKSALLMPDMMAKLVLSLSRAQLPVPASSLLRLMLVKQRLPPLDVLRMVFLHLVKTETGVHLASNILEEICDVSTTSSKLDLPKPDVTIFNLVLDACIRFGTTLKGQEIIELMAQVGVIADAHTAVIIAHLHEANGMRDELKKLKYLVDMAPVSFFHHYQQFYDCLLTLHFEFNDIDAVSALLTELCGCCGSNTGHREQLKYCTVSIGPENIKTGFRLQFLPQQLERDFVFRVRNEELVLYKNGKFVLSNRGLAKLVIGYKKSQRISELAKFLISIQNMLISAENNSPCSDVIDACIRLEWLETAHDILEDLESEKYCIREGSYRLLLGAYYGKNMVKEVEGLVRQMRRVGFKYRTLLDSKELISEHVTDLANCIILNMRDDEKSIPFLVREYNSSIYFFTKAKMIEDAQQTYRRMQRMNIQTNGSTFFHLMRGYCSMGMYREITHLWGDIKRSMARQDLIYDREVYELLVLNFIRGGYFERVMEVIGFMMEKCMFLDKWRYKTEYLKFHRDLYRRLVPSEAKDDTQLRRMEHVRAFKKFVGS